ncbi:3'-5' exonuclease [Deinococcus peraridilitoris]|uniref:DNA polymerase III epsilon subunit-like 3'-5' exonuclease n=1 Tax=Deinococcus peraridilitoris (strain DSM 19664 / LMG 22246 / CIP 109416 / KR-200) TaxID=937777 RepID=L0A1Q5_DEIPD|nr:3'-5' exonuclease [Deinococcus peraridilitoris]AFZ67384.1 DNA polymerase III epsilon subunit-like 3'-5' exonuclease [Deinococcus peraridilitoris DSM 19664]
MASIVFVDVETGGLDPERHSLLTVGLVTLDTRTGELSRPTLLKVRDTPYRVEAEALEINRIDLQSHHGQAAEREHAAHELHAYLQYRRKKRVMVGGHNVSFDLRFLRALLPSWNEVVLGGVIDTKVIAHFLMHTGALPRLQSSRLEDLAAHFDVRYEAHDALEDARATALVYARMLKLAAERT